MLTLELARTLHDERQRGIEARSRVGAFVAILATSKGGGAGRPDASAEQPPRSGRTAGLKTSDGRS